MLTDLYVESHPAFPIYSSKLERGWLFGLKADNSDIQYASFRNNIPILVAVLAIHVVVSLAIRLLSSSGSQTPSSQTSMNLRSRWTLGFSVLFLFGLFGASAIKVLAIVSLHYWIVASVRPHSLLAPITTWTFSIVILFMNDYFKGYQFGALFQPLSFLDEIKGSGMRWNIIFNFTVLRMISFTMDKYWSLKEFDHNAFEMHAIKCKDCQNVPYLCKRQRSEQSHPYRMYNFTNYLIFCLYAPLYVAGPIMSYNDFWHQMKHQPKNTTAQSSLTYTLRWLGVVFLMEVMMHCAHVVAIKDTKAWQGLFNSFEIFLVGFFNLKMIWLKVNDLARRHSQKTCRLTPRLFIASHYLEVLSDVGNV